MVKLTIQQAQAYIHSTESMVRQLEINTFSLNDLYNPIFYHEQTMTGRGRQGFGMSVFQTLDLLK